MFSNNGNTFLYLISSGIAILVAIILLTGFFYSKKKNKEQDYEEQLLDLLTDENKQEEENTKSIPYRWNKFWGSLFKESGLSRYSNDEAAGREILILLIVLVASLSAVTRNPAVGTSLALVVIWVISMLLKSKTSKKEQQINNQLPGFLFAIKANIQANETPERAILKVVDSMPSPLYDDILIVKKKILANASFKEALEELIIKTSSKDLKFLAACMIQATASGANLETQISTIQKVLDARRKVSAEIEKAVRASQPAIVVASVAIPGVFIAMYFWDASAKDFWFVNVLSWVALAGVFALYGLGIWLTRKLVGNIRNL